MVVISFVMAFHRFSVMSDLLFPGMYLDPYNQL